MSHPSHLLPPVAPGIKINVDVGFIEPRFFQVIAVARNFGGHCLGWQVRRICGNPPPAASEARALLEGMRMAGIMVGNM